MQIIENGAMPEGQDSPGAAPDKRMPEREQPGRAHLASTKRRPGAVVLTFLIMAGAWVVLSGKSDAFHLSLGAISCAIVAWTSADLLFSAGPARITATWLRFAFSYIPWLMLEIVKANIWLLYLSFHPRMRELIDPHVITFSSSLRGNMPLTTFANSITLTPGTITVYATVDGKFMVHAIDAKSASGLPGTMEAKVARTFGA
jgi:multicomponent Na+:H+ antiporter subunit E